MIVAALVLAVRRGSKKCQNYQVNQRFSSVVEVLVFWVIDSIHRAFSSFRVLGGVLILGFRMVEVYFVHFLRTYEHTKC